MFINSGATDIVLVTLSSTAVETATAQCTSRCAMARGHRLNTSIVLAAVHGLSGLVRAVSAVEPFTLSSPPHSVPVPNKPSRLRGRKATQTCEKTVHNRCIIKNIASLYNFSVGSYTEFMEENFKVSPKSVDSGRWNTQENYLWKSQTKDNRGLSRSWPFHIILNRKVEPVNRRYAEQAFSNQ